jgi:serine/threonine protein kinase
MGSLKSPCTDGEQQKQQPESLSDVHIDRDTCGLSDQCFDTKTGSLRAGLLQQLQTGQKLCTKLVAEFVEAGTHHLVTEFHPGGYLFSELKRSIAGVDRTKAFIDLDLIQAREDVARSWMRQLCLAVQFLHGSSVAHLDVSFENICLDEYNNARLIDFGAATRHPAATPADVFLATGVTLSSLPLPDADNCRRCAACALDCAELYIVAPARERRWRSCTRHSLRRRREAL